MAFYRDASLKQSIKVGTAVVVVIDDDGDEDGDDDDDALSKKIACCAHMCFHQTNKETDRPFKKVLIFVTDRHTLHHNIYIVTIMLIMARCVTVCPTALTEATNRPSCVLRGRAGPVVHHHCCCRHHHHCHLNHHQRQHHHQHHH